MGEGQIQKDLDANKKQALKQTDLFDWFS